MPMASPRSPGVRMATGGRSAPWAHAPPQQTCGLKPQTPEPSGGTVRAPHPRPKYLRCFRLSTSGRVRFERVRSTSHAGNGRFLAARPAERQGGWLPYRSGRVGAPAAGLPTKGA